MAMLLKMKADESSGTIARGTACSLLSTEANTGSTRIVARGYDLALNWKIGFIDKIIRHCVSIVCVDVGIVNLTLLLVHYSSLTCPQFPEPSGSGQDLDRTMARCKVPLISGSDSQSGVLLRA